MQWLTDSLDIGLGLGVGVQVLLHLGPDVITRLALEGGHESVDVGMGEQVGKQVRARELIHKCESKSGTIHEGRRQHCEQFNHTQARTALREIGDNRMLTTRERKL